MICVCVLCCYVLSRIRHARCCNAPCQTKKDNTLMLWNAWYLVYICYVRLRCVSPLLCTTSCSQRLLDNSWIMPVSCTSASYCIGPRLLRGAVCGNCFATGQRTMREMDNTGTPAVCRMSALLGLLMRHLVTQTCTGEIGV